jgi:hypothetical protein
VNPANENWLIERHGHRAPAQFRRDQMDAMPLAAQTQSGVPEIQGRYTTLLKEGRP